MMGKDMKDLEKEQKMGITEDGVDMARVQENLDEGLIDITSDEALEAAPNEAEDFEGLIAERDALKDRLMRALAESENMRKRAERDRREAEIYGGTKLARDILAVYDNLNRALMVADEAQREVAGPVIEGVELTLKEILNAFSKHGISRLDPKKGDMFNPQHHQGMFEAPVPGTRAGEIIEVMDVGFLIHDRLLRPAKVGVSSMPASQPKTEAELKNAEAESAPKAELDSNM